jgi:hypothetical protein
MDSKLIFPYGCLPYSFYDTYPIQERLSKTKRKNALSHKKAKRRQKQFSQRRNRG